jgi:hypothetical protein
MMERERIINPNRCIRLLGLAAVLAAGCTAAAQPHPIGKGENAMKLTSTAFQEGRIIPVNYTGVGADVSPPLQWSGAPASTKSFALICDDPDAPMGTWVHWVIYGLPAATTGLPENTAAVDSLPGGTRQGMNDFGRVGYGGPLPPPGKPHRYFFKLYALDSELPLKARATKEELLRAMDGHILGEAQLMGTYQRAR